MSFEIFDIILIYLFNTLEFAENNNQNFRKILMIPTKKFKGRVFIVDRGCRQNF